MIAFIRGKLLSLRSNDVIIETGGIGYKISIPLSSVNKMEKIGSEVSLYTSFIVGEDKFMLMGFLHPGERDLFEMFYSLSGIGPKTALSLVGHLSLNEITKAVNTKNSLPFTKVPGVGKKTAEKLLIELKGKIEKIEGMPQELASHSSKDAVSALINLGYNQKKAEIMVQRALEKIPLEEDLSLLISAALKFS